MTVKNRQAWLFAYSQNIVKPIKLSIMTQDEKDLLLKDLCARLPYRIKCLVSTRISTYTGIIESIGLDGSIEIIRDDSEYIRSTAITNCKPYLFPLSSMTEEQRLEYDKIIYHSIELHHREYSDVVEIDLFDNLQEFYHKNHFDYRGLIEKRLAIDATSKNIY